MNERVAVSQASGLPLANLVRSHNAKVTKPQSDQTLALDPNGSHASLDHSAVASEKMPPAGLNAEPGDGRTLTGEQFSQNVPITDDQSAQPAADPSSGADFRDVSIESLPGSSPLLALMTQEMPGTSGRGSADTGAGDGDAAHAQSFGALSSAIVGSAPTIGTIPAPGGAGTQVFEAGLLATRGPGESDGTHAGNPAFQTTTRNVTINFSSPAGLVLYSTLFFHSSCFTSRISIGIAPPIC